ncbi:MAG: hypothetical protein LUQ07_05880, partial [Methanospirillum sp.]|nr:hypothetical protein [Methanospirillum sp.]
MSTVNRLQLALLVCILGLLIVLSVSSFTGCILQSHPPQPDLNSFSPVPPPGVMPVVILNGTPYQMGYQYAMQVPEYIALARDAAWVQARTARSEENITREIATSREYIRRDLKKFDFLSFFQGISDSMQDQGYPFSPDDPLVIHTFGGRPVSQSEEHCSGFALSSDKYEPSLITGINFDYYMITPNSYEVLLVLYPGQEYSCILPSGAGRMGTNIVMNEKGLVYQFTSAPS